MRAVAGPAVVLALGLTLSGCTSAAARTSPAPSVAAGQAVAGDDVGNDRPQVSHDGLMVRRRVVIALHDAPDTDLDTVRRQLDLAAAGRRTTLSPVSASVLDAAVLDRLVPDLVLALPEGATATDAASLYDAALASGPVLLSQVQRHEIVPVLLHDLRFTVQTADPAGLSLAISREGILADALGDYSTTLGPDQVGISYTGPLLSDRLVQAVRVGMARPAGLDPDSVAVSPRSTTGVGVDLTREAAPPPEPAPSAGTATTHHHGATPPPVPPSGAGS